jgi:20S proteasome alpha/beta subunit
VTIAIGLMHEDGILICADTRLTSASKTDESKIKGFVFPHAGDSKAIFAFSGNVPIARMTIDDFRRALKKIPKDDMKLEVMVEAIRAVLLDTYQMHIHPNPDRGSGEYDIAFIIALWSHIDGLGAYSTSGTAVTRFHYSECVGSGSYLADYLLSPHISLFLASEDWMTRVACHVLKEVKAHDSQCGGSTDVVSISNEGKVGQQHSFLIEEDEEYSDAFNKMISSVFIYMGDADTPDEEFNEALRDLVKELKQLRRNRKKGLDVAKQRMEYVITLGGPSNH